MYSVIISSIGRFQYLKELYQSIINQTLSADEIIFLLDDNNFCRENAIKFKYGIESKIIFCENLNISGKRNYGAEIASNEYIFFSDDDDIWMPNKAELCFKEIGSSPVLVHDFTKFGAKNQKPQLLHGKKSKIITLNSLINGTNVYGGGSSILTKREIVLSIKFKDNLSYSEDYDWFVRLLLADVNIQYLPYPLVKYRSHNNNATNNKMKLNLVATKAFFLFLLKSIYLLSGSIVGIIKSLLKLLIFVGLEKPIYFLKRNKFII